MTSPAPSTVRPTETALLDAVVIGGGAAGLTAATSLARFRYRVVVVDAGQPRNAPAHGVHNLLGLDGVAPGDLLAAGRRDLAAYGADVVEAAVVSVHRTAPAAAAPEFRVELADGSALRARRVVVASGLVDDLPDIEGLAERWGRDVLHCPFCHGWEVRDQRIVVLATAARSLHATLLWRRLSEHVTVVLSPGVEPSDAQWQQFAARGVGVVEAGAPAGLVVEGDRLTGVRLSSGRVVPADAVAVATTMRARVEFLAPLGLAPVEFAMGPEVLGTRLESGEMGLTAVPGVYVAGNAGDPMAQVATAAAAGLTTAAAVNASLLEEDTAVAVSAGVTAPGPGTSGAFSAAAEREVGELVLGDRRHGL
ncbi:FAD-dependent oxidoreductase [Kineococcus sp. R8]|uniref:NAD(P)/FAD-dependent oxidoreductase n=1 Tax=Kineococcus siccus TaxID=2696567 RepID=UPI0014122DDD|nr:NAD(P)/FAD-dependent oxidoreductase [Kineococcus siccus]NAZ83243.1 FAD-dependent oxidoreductase [Kineococcus siccus]